MPTNAHRDAPLALAANDEGFQNFLSGGGSTRPDANGQLSNPDPFQGADLNQLGPGVGEAIQVKNRPFYEEPGAMEQRAAAGPGVGQQFISRMLQQYGGMVGQNNPTAQAYQQFLQNRPDIAQDPGLAPYYENAQRQALEGINQNAAARGAYGSSAALASGQEAMTNLAAERANREADYNLRRLAEQRGWEGLGGQLAGQQSASQLGWAQGLGGMGLQGEGLGADIDAKAQQLSLARTGQGFQEASTAQQLRENRIQNLLNAQFQREALYAPLLLNYQGGTIDQNIDLLGGAAGGQTAAATQGANVAGEQANQFLGDAGSFADIIGTLKGAGV